MYLWLFSYFQFAGLDVKVDWNEFECQKFHTIWRTCSLETLALLCSLLTIYVFTVQRKGEPGPGTSGKSLVTLRREGGSGVIFACLVHIKVLLELEQALFTEFKIFFSFSRYFSLNFGKYKALYGKFQL